MLKQRVQTAALLLPPVVVLVYFGGLPLVLLTCVVFAIINYEYFTFATRLPRQRVLQLTVLNAMVPLGYLWKGFPGMAGALVLAVLLAFTILIVVVESEVHEISFSTILPATLLGVCYTGVLGCMLIVCADQVPGYILLWAMLVVVCADTAAFFTGRAIGGAKLAPRISPNKTISGGIGGLIGAAIGSALIGYLLGITSIGILLCYGVVLGVLAVVGDLAESLVKRAYSVKDTGTILPGHGGLLDRVDALLFALPAVLFVPFM